MVIFDFVLDLFGIAEHGDFVSGLLAELGEEFIFFFADVMADVRFEFGERAAKPSESACSTRLHVSRAVSCSFFASRALLEPSRSSTSG